MFKEMATLELTLRYRSPSDLAAHVAEQPGALLLRVANPAELAHCHQLQLYIRFPGGAIDVTAELLQALPGLGLVVRPASEIEQVLGKASAGPTVTPPAISSGPPAEERQNAETTEATEASGQRSAEQAAADKSAPKRVGHVIPPGSSVLSWPIEKLQTEFSTLAQPDKIRLARHGKRPARQLVMRSQDKTLLPFLISNTKIGADEVAAIAGMINIDPPLLRRIATSSEWVRHTNVARALICHPKLSMPLVQKVLPNLSLDELRRLVKTGSVRASVKQMIMKRLNRS
jgi:hypothetical protein